MESGKRSQPGLSRACGLSRRLRGASMIGEHGQQRAAFKLLRSDGAHRKRGQRANEVVNAALITEHGPKLNAVGTGPRPVGDPAHQRRVRLQRAPPEGVLGFEKGREAVGRGEENQSTGAQKAVGPEAARSQAAGDIFEVGRPPQRKNLLPGFEASYHKLYKLGQALFPSHHEPATCRRRSCNNAYRTCSQSHACLSLTENRRAVNRRFTWLETGYGIRS